MTGILYYFDATEPWGMEIYLVHIFVLPILILRMAGVQKYFDVSDG